jgi:murein DD-endopeptidase MepM/ murein hydrolase activator NlpD
MANFRQNISKILAAAIRISLTAFGQIGLAAKRCYRPLVHWSKRLLWFFIYPIYKIVTKIKHRIIKISDPAKNKALLILTNKYSIHILIIAISGLIITGNLTASSTREEDYGSNTVIYALVNNQLEPQILTTDYAIANPSEKLNSQADPQAVSGIPKQNIEINLDPSEQFVNGLSTTVSSGTAVLKPNIFDTGFISTAQRTDTIKHTVKDGETISSIAQLYGISVNTILWENNLTARSTIKAGMELSILPGSGVRHKVARGETLGSISKKYGIDADKIATANGLGNSGLINIGQSLIIPGGVKQQVAYVKTKTSYQPTNDLNVKKIFDPTVKGSSGGSGKMLWPTSWRVITQYFGWKHTGLDIDGDYNSPIYAAEDGVITRSGWNAGGYGYFYFIDHGGGIITVYGHLSKEYFKTGDHVKRGDVLGMMGSTGRSTGTHLHFEVRLNGKYQNPLSYIK